MFTNMSSQHGVKGFAKAAATTNCCFCSNRCVGDSSKQVLKNYRPFISIMKTILFQDTTVFFDEWNSLTTDVDGDLCNDCFAQYSIHSAPLVSFRGTLEALYNLPEEDENNPQFNALLETLKAGKCVFLSDVEYGRNLARKLDRCSNLITSIPCNYESGHRKVERFYHIKGMPDKMVMQWLIGSHRLQVKDGQQQVSELRVRIMELEVLLAAERKQKDPTDVLRAVASEFNDKVNSFNVENSKAINKNKTPARYGIRTLAVTAIKAAANAAVSSSGSSTSSSASSSRYGSAVAIEGHDGSADTGQMEESGDLLPPIVMETMGDDDLHDDCNYSPSDILVLFCPQQLRAICPTTVNDVHLLQLLVSISTVFSSEKSRPKLLPWLPDMAHFFYFQGLSKLGIDFLSQFRVCANDDARKYDARKMRDQFDSNNSKPAQLRHQLVCFTSDNVGKMVWSYFKYVILVIRIFFVKCRYAGGSTTSAATTTTVTNTATAAASGDDVEGGEDEDNNTNPMPGLVFNFEEKPTQVKLDEHGLPDMTPPKPEDFKTCRIEDFTNITTVYELSLFDKWNVIFFMAQFLYHTDMWKTLISPEAFQKTKTKSTKVGVAPVHYLVRVIAVQMGLGTDLPPTNFSPVFLVEAKSASYQDYVKHVLDKLNTSTQMGIGSQQQGIFHVGDSEIYKHVIVAAKNDPKYSDFISLPGALHQSWALLHAGKTIFGGAFLNPVEANINSDKSTKVTMNAHRHDLHLLCVAGDAIFLRLVELLCNKGCFKLNGRALNFEEFQQKIKSIQSFEDLSTYIIPWIQMFWTKCLSTNHCAYKLIRPRPPVSPAVLSVSTAGDSGCAHISSQLRGLAVAPAEIASTMLPPTSLGGSSCSTAGAAASEDNGDITIPATMLLMGSFIHYYQWVLAFITSFRICDIGLKHLTEKITWYYYFMSGQVTYQILTGKNIYRSLTWPDALMYQLAYALSVKFKNELRYMTLDERQELINKDLTGLARNGDPKHMANTAKILTQLIAIVDSVKTYWMKAKGNEHAEEVAHNAAGVFADSSTQSRSKMLSVAVALILRLLGTNKNFIEEDPAKYNTLRNFDGIPATEKLTKALLHNASKMMSLMYGVSEGIMAGGPDPKGTSKNTIDPFVVAPTRGTKADRGRENGKGTYIESILVFLFCVSNFNNNIYFNWLYNSCACYAAQGVD
jgi:hypothetical protein